MKHFFKKFLCMIAMFALSLSSLPVFSSAAYADDAVFSESDYEVLANMVGAVETGGQQYGNRDYTCYTPAQMGAETTITLGWCSCYGNNARDLIKMIQDADPAGFASIDADGSIAAMLTQNWVALAWNPTAEQRETLIALISSDTGRACQDQFFRNMVSYLVNYCQQNYTSNPAAIMMFCEMAMLGGNAAANRIFNRVVNDYNGYFSMDCIMAALKDDQAATANSGGLPISAPTYNRRHQLFYTWIQQYIPDEALWGMTPAADPTANGVFTDVQNTNSYYYQPVYWALENQVTSGTSSSTFSPDATCTRAQIVSFLYRLYGNEEVCANAGFTDVQSGVWYANAVNWAAAHGITSGTDAGIFSPNEECTRAQIVTFLYNCIAGSNDASAYSQSFSDVPEDSWFSTPVGWALAHHITSGTSASTFSPESKCTRAQAVTFLYNAQSAA